MKLHNLLIIICCFFTFLACGPQASNTETATAKSELKSELTSNSTATIPQKTEAKKVVEVAPATLDFDEDYLMGKFDPSSHKDFANIKSIHANKNDMYMRQDAYAAFVSMFDAAKKDGVRLIIKSATRPYAHQKQIWEGKWNGSRKVDGQDLSKTIKKHNLRALKILNFSSMPGTSRHHWGTDIDINAFVNSYFEKGQGLKEYEWLQKNAPSFGFCQPYSAREIRPLGYEEEKWHWSYKPVSNILTAQYKAKITDSMIEGFDGAATATEIETVRNYVLGIDDSCL